MMMTGKRAINLERKRQNNLKASFMSLHAVVPNLEDNECASKVIILQKESLHMCMWLSTFVEKGM